MPRFLVLCAALLAASSAAEAASFNIVEATMSGGVPTLEAERALWASGLGPLATEGFEGSFTVANTMDFGLFTVSISGGPNLYRYSGANALTRTEGNWSLGFTDSATLTFSFSSVVTAFGMDWSSLEGTRSSLDYLDSQGNSLTNIFPSTASVTAGFFGVSGVNLTSLSFLVTSVETLEFDHIQLAQAAEVPLPAGLPLLGLSLGGLALLRRRNKTQV